MAMKYRIIESVHWKKSLEMSRLTAAQSRADFKVRLRDLSSEVKKIPKLSFKID